MSTTKSPDRIIKPDTGPWSVADMPSGKAKIVDRHGYSIANTIVGLGPGPYNVQRANARLMAAAPDLYRELAHLVRLIEPLEAEGRLDVPGLATLNGARAAIAKADGHSKP